MISGTLSTNPTSHTMSPGTDIQPSPSTTRCLCLGGSTDCCCEIYLSTSQVGLQAVRAVNLHLWVHILQLHMGSCMLCLHLFVALKHKVCVINTIRSQCVWQCQGIRCAWANDACCLSLTRAKQQRHHKIIDTPLSCNVSPF